MWGEYCCKTEEEDESSGNFFECDGGSIAINSVCCKSNDYQKCPDTGGCKNNRGKPLNVTYIEFHYLHYTIQNDIYIYRKRHIYISKSLIIYFIKSNEDEVDMMAACGSGSIMVITEQNKTDISSPKFPENYPNNMDCTWHIVADHDKRIPFL